jgi:hypothetical protein
MNPHVIVLEAGLVVLKIYTATGVVADRPLRSFARLACGVEKMPSRLGHHDARTESRLGKRRTRSLLSPRQDLQAAISRARVIGESGNIGGADDYGATT